MFPEGTLSCRECMLEQIFLGSSAAHVEEGAAERDSYSLTAAPNPKSPFPSDAWEEGKWRS